MIIIAFCTKTSKILPRIVCDEFRHCAPITIHSGMPRNLIMHQFIRPARIAKIQLTMRDINVLRRHGWRFLYIPRETACGSTPRAFTCVQLCKKYLGIKNIWIQTPDALYRYLAK